MTIIAIDGPAASGKGTLSRRLAERLGYAYLDTGLIYRATARRLLDGGHDAADPAAATRAAEALVPADLERPDLRGDEAATLASRVAEVPSVRAALIAFQRRFARHPPGGAPGAVLDGRDIGTVVCPEAEVKIFLTARPEVRAQRRYEELLGRGDTRIYSDVLADLKERDERDSGRRTAPLKPAADALILDTSDMDADAVFETVLRHVRNLIPETR